MNILERISDYVAHYAWLMPESEALIFKDQVRNYHEFAHEVDQFAKALLARGVEPGDRVAVLTTPRPEYFISFLATASIGAIWLGLNPTHTRHELAYTVADSEPKLLFSIASFEGRAYTEDVKALRDEHPSVAEAIAFDESMDGITARADFLAGGEGVSHEALAQRRAAVKPLDCCLIVYTSGSTGRPKGAMLSHYSLCYGYTTQAAQWEAVTGVPRGICNLPVNHIGSIGDLCCVPLVAGGAIVFMERFDPQQILLAIPKWRVAILASVPTALQYLLALPQFYDADLSSLKMIAWGGAALPADVLTRIRTLAVTPGLAYGMSEVPGSISMSDVDASDEVLLNTVGHPLAGLAIKLIKEDGTPAAVGEAGEIAVKHKNLMVGYFKRPQATAKSYTKDGYFLTGDIGVLRPDGNLRLVGRAKEMFKSGGYNIYPREIELCLEKHPQIVMAAVVGVPDAVFQEVGHAHLITSPSSDVNEEQIKAWCRAHLANYKVPKKIFFHEQLPMLPIGKVDKIRLKEMGDE